MDKYLVKTPREKPDKHIKIAASSKQLKQKTILSLQRVVVVEDIERLKTKLEVSTQSKSILLSSLHELNKKIPPRSVLLSTKIGHTVSKLRKHSEEEVAREARLIYTKWKRFFQDQLDRPQIEVRCDKKTENIRQRGKSLLSEAMRVEGSHNLIDAVERETFHQHKRLVCPSYRRSIRTMVFKLRNAEELRDSVVTGRLSVEDFVKQFKKT